jgi:hypothetical protein
MSLGLRGRSEPWSGVLEQYRYRSQILSANTRIRDRSPRPFGFDGRPSGATMKSGHWTVERLERD